MLFIGTDIIEISRIREAALRHPAMWDKVLTSREKSYCQAKANGYQCLAGRFAAKEAVLKALGLGLRGVSWRDIEILPDEQGQPQVNVYGKLVDRSRELGIKKINLSISHSREYAMAVAIGEGESGCGS